MYICLYACMCVCMSMYVCMYVYSISDEPMLSGIFVDVTSSEISSGSVLYKHVVPTRLYCGQMCMMDDVCTHYKIVSSSLECTLYSGKTTAGSTTSGVLYIKL